VQLFIFIPQMSDTQR